MSLHVRIVEAPAADDLRRLISGALDQMVETPSLLDAELPWAGGPLLVMDGQQQPVLISFDVNDVCRALFNGLDALDRFESSRALLARLHPRLAESSVTGTPRLIILVGNAAPVLQRLGKTMPAIDIRTFRVLEIDRRQGLLIEPPTVRSVCGATIEQLVEQPRVPPKNPPGSAWAVELTEQENSYFQSLQNDRS